MSTSAENLTDTSTKVETTGWLTRLVNSIVGILFGLLLFVASIALLFWNEGRYDLGDLAATAVTTDAAAPNPANEGKLVAVSGPIVSDEQVTDGLYLRPTPAIALARKAEMYAWIQRSETHTTTNTGGSQTTTTTYTYETNWTENPEDSAHFNVRQGHENPPQRVKSGAFRVQHARIGSFDLVDVAGLSLGTPNGVSLDPQVVDLSQGGRLDNGYVYVGNTTVNSPAVGDLRVSYSELPSGTPSTMFGKQQGAALAPYVDAQSHELYQLFPNSTREQAIAQLHTEFSIWTWVLRGVGFLLMWISLGMIFGPISVALDVIPILGQLSRTLIGIVTFVTALILSTITILVSIVLHHPLLLIALALVVAAVVLVGASRQRRPAPPALSTA